MEYEEEQQPTTRVPFLLGASVGASFVLVVATLVALPVLRVALLDAQDAVKETVQTPACDPAAADVRVSIEDTTNVVIALNGETLVTLPFADASDVSILAQTECSAVIMRKYAPDDVGGYILYPLEYATTVYRLDFASRTVTKLYDGSAGDVAVAVHGDVLALVRRDGQNEQLRSSIVVVDTATGAETLFPIPSEYAQAGEVTFSPNGEKIAYAVAVGDPDNERGAMYIIDLDRGTQRAFEDSYPLAAAPVFAHLAWRTNDDLIFAIQ